ncbi:peflin-like isoform X2 [Aethina tumida]|uniref:peflin-like isoform X2 n=1 Tax=Aethina tumida TaxID=116153 RepID=UPI00096B3291|nr:peflin-like isoform X2 [Aethina tumida]
MSHDDEVKGFNFDQTKKHLTREQKKKLLLAEMIREYKKKYGEILNTPTPSTHSGGSTGIRKTPFPNTALTNLPRGNQSMEKWFTGTMETKDEGRVSPKELQQAFQTFQGKHYSDGVCKFVVRLFDLDKNGGLDIKEFESLYYHIKQWLNAFNSYDRDRSGFLDETELDYALKHMDINFTPEFIRYLITRNDPKAKKISLDQYLITCIQIQKYTDEFKSRDTNYSGNINMKYEEFLELIMRCL